MLRTRNLRHATVAVALTACATLAAPAVAAAAPAGVPAPAPGAVQGLPLDTAALFAPVVQAGVPIDALASLAPAIIGAAAGPADAGTPTQAADDPQRALLEQAKTLLANADLPPQVKSALERVITFLDGSGGGGPAIPQDGPVIAQFLYPTIGQNCISDGGNSVGAALAVPGPATLPPPGPKAGQAGFVFTALGTPVPTAEQARPLTVTWLNIDNRKTGTQNLTDAAKINPPDGPATLSTVADTGPGRVIAVISGGLTTQEAGAAPRSCTFLPTVGMFTVA
ncbi:MAG: hypothetical protein ICV72_08370 [Aldersonia sp.]|nr:hypothetical protein [Aldersonia sp.]